MSPAKIRLARPADAPAMAAMSRDLVERGLGWSWTAMRLERSIADAQTNAVVQPDAQGGIAGFGLMRYRDEDAHLLLMAVRPEQRRQGAGGALLAWLERSALFAGIGQVQLEARISNVAARAFYRFHGYRETRLVPGYYQGREAGVRFVKELRLGLPQRQ